MRREHASGCFTRLLKQPGLRIGLNTDSGAKLTCSPAGRMQHTSSLRDRLRPVDRTYSAEITLSGCSHPSRQPPASSHIKPYDFTTKHYILQHFLEYLSVFVTEKFYEISVRFLCTFHKRATGTRNTPQIDKMIARINPEKYVHDIASGEKMWYYICGQDYI